MRKTNKEFKVGDKVNLIIPYDTMRDVKCEVISILYDGSYALKTDTIKAQYYVATPTYLAYCNNDEMPDIPSYVEVKKFIPELGKMVITATGKDGKYRYAIQEICVRKSSQLTTISLPELGGKMINNVEKLDFKLMPENIPITNITKWLNIPEVEEWT